MIRPQHDFCRFNATTALCQWSEKHFNKLVTYETDKYELSPCLIDFLDVADESEIMIEGDTFIWNGAPEELQEGMFQLDEWLKKQDLSGSK